jgi:hypothetical protein
MEHNSVKVKETVLKLEKRYFVLIDSLNSEKQNLLSSLSKIKNTKYENLLFFKFLFRALIIQIWHDGQ